MVGNRTALCVWVLLATGCFSEDRPLNEYVSAGAGGTSNAGGNDSKGDAGEANAGGGDPVGGQGGSHSAGTGGAAGNGNAGNGSAGTAGSNPGGAGGSSAGTAGSSGGDDAGSAGQAGAPIVPVGALCNSSDGAGCDPRQFCIDAVNDACDPNSESTCAGFCAEPAPRADLTTTCESGGCPDGFSCVSDPVDPARNFCTGTKACDASVPCPAGFVCGTDGNCAPDKVACTGTILCPAIPGLCPPGYTHSIYDDCFGPCVPVESCGCQTDFDCVDGTASCDRVTGRCVIPKAPEPRCAQPFDGGGCDARFSAFAFIDGSCREVEFGGCDRNDNRFSSLEECRRRCEGQPVPHECPAGHVLSAICLDCGPTDGCPEWLTLCAQTCDETTECASPFLRCAEGLCRAVCP